MFNPGDLLGPYEIRMYVGAGGMGEVYKCVDSRLNRTVAIKVLSQQLSEQPGSRARIEREARAIAAVSHPNICTLYDVGHHDTTDYLVMEYLDGQTLAQRLEKGLIPFGEALKIAIEIASGLDAAHRLGVVHRDLKPGNIMLTRTGAKLLDFGLAKLPRPVMGPSPNSDTVAANDAQTTEGVLLGTVCYMSPEQLEGKEIRDSVDIGRSAASSLKCSPAGGLSKARRRRPPSPQSWNTLRPR